MRLQPSLAMTASDEHMLATRQAPCTAPPKDGFAFPFTKGGSHLHSPRRQAMKAGEGPGCGAQGHTRFPGKPSSVGLSPGSPASC